MSELHEFPLYITAYLGGFICWIPFLQGRNLCDRVLQGGKSSSFSLTAYVIFGLSIPITIHLVCDVITGTKIAAITRCYRLFSILLPCLVIICYAIPYHEINAIYCIINSQSILLLSGFLIRSYSCGTEIWTMKSALSILMFWTISIASQNFKCFSCDHEQIFNLDVVWLISTVLYYTLVLYKTILWIRQIIKKHLKGKTMNIKEFSCTKNVLILNAVMILNSIFYSHFKSTTYMISVLITYNIGALLVIVLHDYIIGREAAKMKVLIFFRILEAYLLVIVLTNPSVEGKYERYIFQAIEFTE